MNSHTATHLDAPYHHDLGKSIDEMPIDWFHGEAVAVNLFGCGTHAAIGVKELNRMVRKSKRAI